MIRPEETTGPAPQGSDSHDASRAPLPASTRIYVEGQIHPSVRVPMREITLSDTKSFNGRIEKNQAVRVYDCSGPWGDPSFTGTSDQGLPALRREWILARNDVEAYDGRPVQPQDNGYLTEKHAEYASQSERANKFIEFPGLTAERRKPLRSKSLSDSPTNITPVTQLHYARQGIITPEMEFIAIRENMKIAIVCMSG
jgi:phosphomethylpyrimidine synthase